MMDSMPTKPRLNWAPGLTDHWVLRDEEGKYWTVPKLGRGEKRPYRGDRSILQPIAGRAAAAPGQLGVDLVGVTDLARRAAVQVDTVHKWRQRHDTFPEPLAELASGPVWSWEAVERWLRIKRPPGRPKEVKE
jgi:hypothetical protein